MWRWAYYVRRPIHNLYTIYCNYYIQHEIRWMPMNGSSYIVHFCWYYTIHAVSRYLHSKFSICVGKLLIGWYITMPKVKQKVRHVERHDRWKSLPRSTHGALWVSAKFDRRELKARWVWSASWGNVNAELDNPRAESDPRGGSAPRAGGTCKRGKYLAPSHQSLTWTFPSRPRDEFENRPSRPFLRPPSLPSVINILSPSPHPPSLKRVQSTWAPFHRKLLEYQLC